MCCPIVLITDGELDAAPTSTYPSASAPGWAGLTKRAEAATEGRQVGAFALSIGGQTDAALLSKVFPQATIATPGDVVGYLSGLTNELTKVRIAEALDADLTQPLKVAVSDVTAQDEALTATVTFTSTSTILPVTATAPAMTPVPAGATLVMEPEALTLDPGATATARVTISGLQGSGSLALGTGVGSPWAADLAAAGLTLPTDPVLTEAFTFEVATAPTAPPTTAPATPDEPASPTGQDAQTTAITLPSWALPALGALLALIVLGWLIARIVASKLPQLNGSLAIEDGDVVRDELLLTGRSTRATRGATKVRARPRRDGSIDVTGSADGRKFSGTLGDGDTLELGDGATLRFTSRRSRMLEMVTAG